MQRKKICFRRVWRTITEGDASPSPDRGLGVRTSTTAEDEPLQRTPTPYRDKDQEGRRDRGARDRARLTRVSPHVCPQVAGLVEALPALHANEVSLAGLRPGRPWVAVAKGSRRGRGEETIISLSDVT